MKLFHILSILISISVVFSFINYHLHKLPTVIGLMLIAMLTSLALLLLGPPAFGLGIGAIAYWMLKQVDDYTVEVLFTLVITMGVISG